MGVECQVRLVGISSLADVMGTAIDRGLCAAVFVQYPGRACVSSYPRVRVCMLCV